MTGIGIRSTVIPSLRSGQALSEAKEPKRWIRPNSRLHLRSSGSFASLRMTVLAVLLATTSLQAQARLYVANQDDATVSIIDVGSRKLLETVDLRRYGFGDNAKPHHVQVEPDGSAWYVTLIGAGKVVKLDRTNKMISSAPLEVPGLMTFHPTENLMFVGRSMSAVNPPPRMAVIRRTDMKVLDEIDLLFPRPHGIVTHPGGKRVYVASLGTNQIASVGVDEGDVKLIDVAGPAHGFVQAAVSPDGKWLFANIQTPGITFAITGPWDAGPI
jgi:YVTN family beta-propeller protein